MVGFKTGMLYETKYRPGQRQSVGQGRGFVRSLYGPQSRHSANSPAMTGNQRIGELEFWKADHRGKIAVSQLFGGARGRQLRSAPWPAEFAWLPSLAAKSRSPYVAPGGVPCVTRPAPASATYKGAAACLLLREGSVFALPALAMAIPTSPCRASAPEHRIPPRKPQCTDRTI